MLKKLIKIYFFLFYFWY